MTGEAMHEARRPFQRRRKLHPRFVGPVEHDLAGALCQGTTSVVPQERLIKDLGFSPCMLSAGAEARDGLATYRHDQGRALTQGRSTQDPLTRRNRCPRTFTIISFAVPGLGCSLTQVLPQGLRRERSSSAACFSYQIRTRWSGARYSVSPGFTSNDEYQASMLRTVSARYSAGECGSVITC
jgi:hypothetical protein